MNNAKFLVAATLAIMAFGAQATDVTGCDGDQTTAANVLPFGASGAPTDADAHAFVRTGFGITCSANVNLQYTESDANEFLVASGSKKGNQAFKGNSAVGGTIVVDAACDASAGCTDTEVGAALTAAGEMGSSAGEGEGEGGGEPPAEG